VTRIVTSPRLDGTRPIPHNIANVEAKANRVILSTPLGRLYVFAFADCRAIYTNSLAYPRTIIFDLPPSSLLVSFRMYVEAAPIPSPSFMRARHLLTLRFLSPHRWYGPFAAVVMNTPTACDSPLASCISYSQSPPPLSPPKTVCAMPSPFGNLGSFVLTRVSTVMVGHQMETPFHAACERGSVELIRYLLNNGADPNILPMTVRPALITSDCCFPFLTPSLTLCFAPHLLSIFQRVRVQAPPSIG
jgi:hypothetical protein